MLPELRDFVREVRERGAEVIVISDDADMLAWRTRPLRLPRRRARVAVAPDRDAARAAVRHAPVPCTRITIPIGPRIAQGDGDALRRSPVNRFPPDQTPTIAGPWRLLFKPQRTGCYINDHTVLRAHDGVWHLFGITRPTWEINPDHERYFAHGAGSLPGLRGRPRGETAGL